MNHIRAVVAVSIFAIVALVALQWTTEQCYTITIVNSYTDHDGTHLLPPEISRACF